MPPHAGRPFVGKIGEKADHFSARMKLIPAIMHVESRTPHTCARSFLRKTWCIESNGVFAQAAHETITNPSRSGEHRTGIAVRRGGS